MHRAAATSPTLGPPTTTFQLRRSIYGARTGGKCALGPADDIRRFLDSIWDGSGFFFFDLVVLKLVEGTMRGSDLFWCLVVNVCFVAGFNIETFNYAMFRTPPSNSGAMFGFTVALHKEDHQRPW